MHAMKKKNYLRNCLDNRDKIVEFLRQRIDTLTNILANMRNRTIRQDVLSAVREEIPKRVEDKRAEQFISNER
jgi:hypothetical protein